MPSCKDPPKSTVQISVLANHAFLLYEEGMRQILKSNESEA